MFFWNSLACPIIQRMLAISSLVPLPFLIPEGKSGPEGQNNLPTAILTEYGSCGVWTQAFCLCRACSHLLCSAVETTEAVHWKMMGFLHLKRLFKPCFLEGIGTLGAAGGHLGSTPRWKSYKTSPHARLLQWHLFFFLWHLWLRLCLIFFKHFLSTCWSISQWQALSWRQMGWGWLYPVQIEPWVIVWHQMMWWGIDKTRHRMSFRENLLQVRRLYPGQPRSLPSWGEAFSLFLCKWYPFAFIVIQWLSKPCIITGSVPWVLTGLSLMFYNKPMRRIFLESHLTEEAMEAQSQEFKHSQEQWASLSRLHGVLPAPSWFSLHEVLLHNQTEGPSFTLLFP